MLAASSDVLVLSSVILGPKADRTIDHPSPFTSTFSLFSVLFPVISATFTVVFGLSVFLVDFLKCFKGAS